MMGEVPVAGFTVKRELAAWLKRREAQRPEGVTVWRVADGGHGPSSTMMDIEELLA
jgi:hypothetical protein